MSERMFAFAVPLAPLEPGLTDDQLKCRRADAWRLIRSVMPSAATLSGSLLEYRIEGHDGRLWLACDLIESRQRSLLDTEDPSVRRLAGTAMGRLKLEVDRMRREARGSVIRFGEVAQLASAANNGSEPIDDLLSPQDLLLLGVMASGRWPRVEVSVGDDLVQYQLPSLLSFKRGDVPRVISARVETAGRTSAKILVREGIPDFDRQRKGKRVVQLLRTSPTGIRCPHWPAISVASGTGVLVNIKVREARHVGRGTLSHLELVSVENANDIMEAAGYRHIGC